MHRSSDEIKDLGMTTSGFVHFAIYSDIESSSLVDTEVGGREVSEVESCGCALLLFLAFLPGTSFADVIVSSTFDL